MALGGCSSKDASSGDQDLASTGVDFDEEYDVVVVGSGLAGLATAVTVGTEGDGATCLLLEKSDSPLGGGNSAFSGGMIMTTDNYDDCLEYVKALRGENETVSDAICEAYVREAMEHANWLRSLGAPDDFYVSYEDPDGFCQGVYKYDAEYTELDPNASVHGIRFNPDNPDGLTHVIKFLSAKADELADVITRKTKAPAVRLIQDPVSCAIEGVTYLDGNKEVNVRANKGVVMCCGGFENNPEMMANYFKAYGCHPAAAVHNTGDGIRMGAWVGGAIDEAPHCPMYFDEGVEGLEHMPSIPLTRQPWLYLNDLGERFCNESGTYDFILHADASQPGNIHVCLWDADWQTYAQQFDMHGCSRMFPFDNGAAPNLPIEVVTAMNEEALKAGHIQQADTIEELAEKLGLPAEALAKTVERNNQNYDNQRDDDFGKEPFRLSPVRKPPFFGVRTTGALLCTMDGIVINTQGQALREDGSAIEGLYVTGNDSGGYYSMTYPNLSTGNACGRTVTFARMIAQNLAAQ